LKIDAAAALSFAILAAEKYGQARESGQMSYTPRRPKSFCIGLAGFWKFGGVQCCHPVACC
jgi:hypothetical protein